MDFVSYEELEEIMESAEVERVESNGVSGIDGISEWWTIYYNDESEEDVYTRNN